MPLIQIQAIVFVAIFAAIVVASIFILIRFWDSKKKASQARAPITKKTKTVVKQYFEDKQYGRAKAESQVVLLRRAIGNLIGFDYVPVLEDFEYEFDKYRIVARSRCFSAGWVDVFEVEMKHPNDNTWIKHHAGTATINLPPANIIHEFINALKQHINHAYQGNV